MIFEPVKIAVIGCNGYSFQLIKRILTLPQSGVVTSVSFHGQDEGCVQFCRDRGIAVFPSVEALLDDGNFEVVVNPSPIHLHAELTLKCMEAGFAVWLEKPPVASIQEMDLLRSVAEARGISIPVCFNSLYSQLTRKLKEELVEGVYGRVKRVKGIGAWIRTSKYFNRNNWAGRLKMEDTWVLDGEVNNPMAHILCNNLFFASSKRNELATPVEVTAELYRCNPIESEDNSCLRLITDEGIEVINLLTLSPETEIPPLTIIETEKATIHFENFERLRFDYVEGGPGFRDSSQEDRIEMIQHLCWAFRTGEPYFCNLDSIRPFTLAVNGAFESAGEIQTIPEKFIVTRPIHDGVHRSVPGIERWIRKGAETNQLYSEMGVPWARPSDPFSLSDYSHFPVRFCSESLTEEARRA